MACRSGSGREGWESSRTSATGEDTISAHGSILALLVGAALLAGCASGAAPVLRVEDARFAAPFVGLPERAAQIERAAAGLGWRTVRAGPGRIRASSDAAGRGTVVTIDFDGDSFSIRYEDSREPRHGGGDLALERNAAIASLRDAILAQSSV